MTTKLWPDRGIVPATEIEDRIARVRQQMVARDLAALLVVQRVDLYYLSGTAQRGYLYLPIEEGPLLLLRKHAGRGRFESPLPRSQIIDIDSVKQLPEHVVDRFGKLPPAIGFELDVMPYNEVLYLQRLLGDCRVLDGSPALLAARAVKSAWEIERLEQSARISCETFAFIGDNLRPGLTEMELAGLYECYARSLGSAAGLRVRNYQTEGYPWHVLSGDSGGLAGLMEVPASGAGTSAAFPCGAGARKIRAGEPIMIDFASVHDGYHMDETRMFAISEMPCEALEACRAAIEIHDEVIARIRPGAIAGELYRHAVAVAERLGQAETFRGPRDQKVSFVAHGIGLELIEPPFLAANKTDKLEPNMVFALEPKLVLEGQFSAGIESVVAVTETGSRLISQTPVEIFVKP